MSEIYQAAKEIGSGLAWLGFWIGLGLYNFQGCGSQARDFREALNKPTVEMKK